MGHMGHNLTPVNTEAIDTATEAAVKAFNAEPDAYLDDHDLARMAAHAAVVAELRRLADQYAAGCEDYIGNGASEIKRAQAVEALTISKSLRKRAAELDGVAR